MSTVTSSLNLSSTIDFNCVRAIEGMCRFAHGMFINAIRYIKNLRLDCYSWVTFQGVSESAANQVRHLDEECVPVASESWLRMTSEVVEAVVIQIVVVTHVKGSPGIRGPAKEKLSAQVCFERVVIESHSRKGEARELVRGAQRVDVIVESNQASVVANQSIFDVIEINSQRVGWLVSDGETRAQFFAGTRIQWRVRIDERCRTNAWEFRSSAEIEIKRIPEIADGEISGELFSGKRLTGDGHALACGGAFGMVQKCSHWSKLCFEESLVAVGVSEYERALALQVDYEARRVVPSL